jgi:uncharacterized protein
MMAVSAVEQKKRVSRRTFLKGAGIAAIGFPLYAAEISRHEISIERRTIHIRRLPEAFRGFRIVQISDFHYEEFTEPFFLREIVRRVNSLKPDAVVLNGDFVTVGLFPRSHTIRSAAPCAEILGGIECPIKYAVLGNHDTDFAEPEVVNALAMNRLPLLSNSFQPLERAGQRLWVAGTGDACKRKMDLAKAVPPASVTNGEPVILIVHEPDVLPDVARYKVDLMLSGHTHGGQVRIPFLPLIHLPPLGKKYVDGLFRLGDTQLYVNRGIGTVGVPMRFNCPPEITEITLEADHNPTI